MTAIIAFAKGDVAFVAADTRRVFPIYGPITARKVHRWSSHVVLAQCGDGKGITDLIFQMLELQPLAQNAHPGIADDAVLIRAFKLKQPAAYATAVKSVTNLASGAAHISGAILVASAEDAFGPARLHRLDFRRGTVRQLACAIRAEGSDPRAFTRNARSLASIGSSAPFQMDIWGEHSIARAIASHPRNVGWPVDLLLARATPSGERYVVERRLTAPGSTPLPEFLV